MSISIAMVALGVGAKLSPSAIQVDLAQQWSDLPPVSESMNGEDTFGFRIGSQDVIIARMPMPIPWSDLEGPCATSWLWKDAASVLRTHKEHLIVTVMSQERPTERMRLLTQAVASVLATCPEAVGVYWGAATLVIAPKMFRDLTTEFLPDQWPLYLWVDTRVGKSSSGRTCGFTAGMEAIGLKEFETEDASDEPGELRERFYAMAAYLLEHGPVINDGDTIGEDADEQIQVVFADSVYGHKGQVMRLNYTPTKPKKRGWFR